MRNIKILVKRDFKEKLSSIKNSKKDFSSIVLNVLLTLVLVSVFALSFSYFAKTYSNIQIGYFKDFNQRVYEILTIFFTVLSLLLVLIGVVKLNKNLIEVSNATLLSLPITPFQIFISKLFSVYFEMLLTCFVITLPVIIILAIQKLIGLGVIFLSLIAILLLPMLGLGLASVLTIPFFYIKRWLNKHSLIQLFVYILFVIVAFLIYTLFLRFVKGLIESGQIKFFFNEASVLKIQKLCFLAFPFNIFSKMVIGQNLIINNLFIILIAVVSVLIAFLMSKVIFTLVRQNKINTKNDNFIKKTPREARGVVKSIISKEFLMVLRTPSLAFNYFAIILTLPLMVVVTAGLMISMMSELTLLNCNFEIVLCAISMYSILLNTFCANNISREGKFFNILKTFPVSAKKVVFSKILFCVLTSVVSVFISTIVVYSLGYISILKAIAVFFISIILNIGVVCLATRKDMNTTMHKKGEENNASVNFLIFWGLIFSICLTVVSLAISLYLQTRFNLLVSGVFSCLILLLLSVIICMFSIIYLLRNLKKKYKEIIL